MSNIRIIKRKAKGFFETDDLPKVQKAVQSVSNIISEASILVKAYYLDWFQRHYPLDNINDCLQIDHDMFTTACNIVQGSKVPSVRGQGERQNAKTSLFYDMLSVYYNIYDRNGDITIIQNDLSLSHILSYSVDNLLTAYDNNIKGHFTKYIKRYILCDLLTMKIDRKKARKIAAIITSHYFYDAEIPSDVEGIIISKEKYAFLFPEKINKNGFPRCYDVSINPWVYLYKMVEINLFLEFQFYSVEPKYRKLFNPLPLHSSFVPMHVRMDTSGISQLLMTQEKIKEFKALYEIEHPGTTLNMKTKGDMLSSFNKLFGRDPDTKEEGSLFATDMWAFLTNLKKCRQWKEINNVKKDNICWVFDNAIITDGISISFQVIDKDHAGRKIRKKKSEDNQVKNEKEKQKKVKCHSTFQSTNY